MKTLEVLDMVLKGKRIKPITLRHYREVLGAFARYSEDWPKSGVVVDEWTASLSGYADTTIKMWFEYLTSAGKYAEKTGGKYANGSPRVPNPCAEATRPKVLKKRRRYFTTYELVRIIKACRYEKDKVLILTLIDSTARIGELVGLTPKNIGEAWIDVKGKTGERRYRLDSVICAKLKSIAGGDDKPVFQSRFGGFATVEALKNRVHRVIVEAGITGSKLGAHTLRHSGASLVAQETGSALAVKALLQHDDIKTSMVYIHDAEDVIQQRISPLRLIGERVLGEDAFGATDKTKQLTMGGEVIELEASEVEKAEADMPAVMVDLLDDEFPEIAVGVKVRPLLKTDDLRLIRQAFLGYIRSGDAGSSEVDMRYLLRRMLRKQKMVKI